MKQYLIVVILLLIIGLFGCTSADRTEDTIKKPNILFILTDDQPYDAIHAMGNKDIITPTLDSLKYAGTAFSNAYIMGGSSPAVCMPSRAMLLTGRSLFHISQDKGGNPYHNGAIIPSDHKTFPEVFREAGYTTFGTGKWHQDHASFNRSFSTGKNLFFDGMGDHFRLPLQDYKADGNYLSYDSLKKVKEENLELPKGKHATETFTDGVIDFLENHDANDPFMVYLAYTAPHDPREMPEKYRTMYDEKALSLPENFLPEHPFDNGELTIRDENLAPFPRTDSAVRAHLADYYAMVTHIDENLKRVFQLLKNKGLDKNTIVVFTSDNGLALGSHGLMGKQSLYEHSIKVPLIISGPGVPIGEVKEYPVYLTDLFPTLCDMTGLEIPQSVLGKSILPILQDDVAVHENLYFAYTHLQRAIREDDFKLIEYAVGDKRETQLFNLKNDPQELKNLASDPEHQEKLENLQRSLQERAYAMGDTLTQGRTFWKNMK